jgi:large subunit ribosomal protein L30
MSAHDAEPRTSRTGKPVDGDSITVTQIRSTISIKPKSKGTMRALGLRKIGDTNTLPDRPEIRGMIARVPHLITVTENAAADTQNVRD